MGLSLHFLIAIPLAIGFVFAWRKSRPVLTFFCAAMLLYSVVAPVYGDVMRNAAMGIIVGATKAQLLLLVSAILVVGVNLIPMANAAQTTYSMNDRPMFEPQTILMATGFLSLLSLIVTIVAEIMMPGLLGSWSREQLSFETMRGMGVLHVFNSLMLMFPVGLYYCYKVGYRFNPILYVLAAINVIVGVVPMLFSGVTTRPMLLLLPFAVLLCWNGRTIALGRLAVATVIGYFLFTLFRFMRLIGEWTIGGTYTLRFSDLLDLWTTSSLRAEASFNEIHFFAASVNYIDGGGDRLGGKSYILGLVQFIPSYIWPDKLFLVQQGRVDAFVRDAVFKDTIHALLPIGYYGEAYVNFGFIGIIIASIILGFVIRYADARALTSWMRIPGTLFIALSIPYFVLLCRMHSYDSLATMIPQLLCVWAACAFFHRFAGQSETQQLDYALR